MHLKTGKYQQQLLNNLERGLSPPFIMLVRKKLFTYDLVLKQIYKEYGMEYQKTPILYKTLKKIDGLPLYLSLSAQKINSKLQYLLRNNLVERIWRRCPLPNPGRYDNSANWWRVNKFGLFYLYCKFGNDIVKEEDLHLIAQLSLNGFDIKKFNDWEYNEQFI